MWSDCSMLRYSTMVWGLWSNSFVLGDTHCWRCSYLWESSLSKGLWDMLSDCSMLRDSTILRDLSSYFSLLKGTLCWWCNYSSQFW